MTDAMEVTISALDAKGHGIAHTARGPITVPFTVPGDVVRVELRGKRKGVRHARVVERIGDAAERAVPRCPYVGQCGGCPWQMIDYPAQLRYKREAVRAALAGLPIPEIEDTIPSPDLFYFRNRMDYAIGVGGVLGLKASEQWWNVLDLSTCFLLSPEAVTIMERVREWMRAHAVVPWDNRSHRGFARYLVIREGKRTGERMVHLITAPGELPGRDDLIARLRDLATSILWGVNPRITDLSTADTIHVLHGNTELHEQLILPSLHIEGDHKRVSPAGRTAFLGTVSDQAGMVPPEAESAGGQGTNEHAGRVSDHEERIRPKPETVRSFTFTIPPNAFFQTNTAMAEQLVDTVREFAALTGTELVVDLYCGVGVFGIALARDAARVIGVESEPSAIPVAQRNAAANGVTNAQFQLATAETWPFPIDPIDLLIIDPPRSGLHPRVVQKILALQPERIIYVSCNPSALARDLKPLLDRYACDAIRCLDLFPHSPHVETVVRLARRSP